MIEKPDYYLCVYCGHEKVLYKDKKKHEQTQDHQDFSRLNWYQHQLGLGDWTVEKLKEVQDRFITKKIARYEKVYCIVCGTRVSYIKCFHCNKWLCSSCGSSNITITITAEE